MEDAQKKRRRIVDHIIDTYFELEEDQVGEHLHELFCDWLLAEYDWQLKDAALQRKFDEICEREECEGIPIYEPQSIH